ncbi:hypothetical protein FACS18945_3150 [Bacteroidia bacterium]|nr:hypothetical protein FACS18945_3150 [Bacteroidia bacterium]
MKKANKFKISDKKVILITSIMVASLVGIKYVSEYYIVDGLERKIKVYEEVLATLDDGSFQHIYAPEPGQLEQAYKIHNNKLDASKKALQEAYRSNWFITK